MAIKSGYAVTINGKKQRIEFSNQGLYEHFNIPIYSSREALKDFYKIHCVMEDSELVAFIVASGKIYHVAIESKEAIEAFQALVENMGFCVDLDPTKVAENLYPFYATVGDYIPDDSEFDFWFLREGNNIFVHLLTFEHYIQVMTVLRRHFPDAILLHLDGSVDVTPEDEVFAECMDFGKPLEAKFKERYDDLLSKHACEYKVPADFLRRCYGSIARNTESEIIFRNIMVILSKAGNTWRKLDFSEYEECRKEDGHFSDTEKDYFERVIAYTQSPEKAREFVGKNYFELI